METSIGKYRLCTWSFDATSAKDTWKLMGCDVILGQMDLAMLFGKIMRSIADLVANKGPTKSREDLQSTSRITKQVFEIRAAMISLDVLDNASDLDALFSPTNDQFNPNLLEGLVEASIVCKDLHRQWGFREEKIITSWAQDAADFSGRINEWPPHGWDAATIMMDARQCRNDGSSIQTTSASALPAIISTTSSPTCAT